jgi:pyridoxamine 5'-phosphate oxidase
MISDVQKLRLEYARFSLDETDVAANPIQQFEKWFEEALSSNVLEPNAMTLATSDAEGKPAARIVLLKGLTEGKFVFFTNYQSRKGEEIAQNARACLVFFWKELERQVRIEGSVSKIDESASTQYFQSRPKASQIGAWVSPQSSVVENRVWLEREYLKVTEQFKDSEVLPRPPHWGGYALTPEKIEFWQGRQSRLHDRILYTLTAENVWKTERLAP